MSDFIINKRNHGIIIFESSIKGFTNFIIPFGITLLPAIRSGKLGSLLFTLIIFLAFFGLETVYAVASWIFKTYSIEKGILTIRYGVFIKKNREIPIHKIVTLHEMQTVTQRLFRAWTLKLDTGSSLLKETEARLVVSAQDLETIRKLLKPDNVPLEPLGSAEKNFPAQTIVYRSKASSLIKMGLTSNAIFAGLLVILSLFQFLSDIFDDRINEFLGQAEDFFTTTELKLTTQLLLILAVILTIYSIVSLITAAITSLIKYHDFKVIKGKDLITVQYGLLRKNSFSFRESKIRAVYLKQSIIRQWFGLVTVHIESVGYGNEKGEEAILIPLAALDEIHSVLTHIIGDYEAQPEYVSAPKRSWRRFIVATLFFPLLLIVPISIFYAYGFISLILIPFFLWSALLKYKNSGIAWNAKSLFLRYGGFTRVEAHIKREGIQAVIKKATPFQRMARLFTLNVSIQGNVFGKTLTVRHMEDSLFPDIEKLI